MTSRKSETQDGDPASATPTRGRHQTATNHNSSIQTGRCHLSSRSRSAGRCPRQKLTFNGHFSQVAVVRSPSVCQGSPSPKEVAILFPKSLFFGRPPFSQESPSTFLAWSLSYLFCLGSIFFGVFRMETWSQSNFF